MFAMSRMLWTWSALVGHPSLRNEIPILPYTVRSPVPMCQFRCREARLVRACLTQWHIPSMRRSRNQSCRQCHSSLRTKVTGRNAPQEPSPTLVQVVAKEYYNEEVSSYLCAEFEVDNSLCNALRWIHDSVNSECAKQTSTPPNVEKGLPNLQAILVNNNYRCKFTLHTF